MLKIGITVLLFLIKGNTGQDLTIEINQGVLTGKEMEDRNGDTFYSFQSIPFAKPPVGDLRFKEPEAAEPWDGELDATVDLPFCHQEDYDGNTYGQEDCLYLNVYTKQLQSEANDVSLDVMVWIHGGGFTENAGRQDLFSPEYLLTEDIVLVTINYRLGIFGSFHLDDTSLGYPGNLGLKDQSLALKWVQTNIANFGGNPNSVTIFGESAGGASVHFHVLSPLSTGTFHKAIIQSGTAISPWVTGIRNNGILLAEALNVDTENSTTMIEDLLEVSGDAIYAANQRLIQQYNVGWASISIPIVEDEVDGLNNFITEEPLVIIANGTYNDVPLMVGYNDAEGISFQWGYTDLASFIPGEFEIEEDSSKESQLIEELQDFYFGGEETTAEREPIIQLYTDSWFSYPAYRLAKEHQKTANNPIYFYRFSADTQLNVYKLRYDENANFTGATHCDELGYLFHTYYHDDIIPNIGTDSLEDNGIKRIVALWTNFAKYGNPTPDESTNFEWLPITNDVFNYVDFGTSETVPGVDPDSENIEFWDDVYDRYSSGIIYKVQPLVVILCFCIAYLKHIM